VAINSTNEANKAAGIWVKQSIYLDVYDLSWRTLEDIPLKIDYVVVR